MPTIEKKSEPVYTSIDSFVFYGTMPDGVICSNQFTCKSVPSKVKLELVDPKKEGICGKYVCVLEDKETQLKLNGKFDYPPYDPKEIPESVELDPVPKVCEREKADEFVMSIRDNDERFSRQHLYFWGTEPFKYMQSIGIPIEGFQEKAWDPVKISIDRTIPCNAYYNYQNNEARFGSCSFFYRIKGQPFEHIARSETDGTCIMHEVGGHAAIHYVNPAIGLSYDDPFGGGLHEAGDVVGYFVTGNPMILSDFAPSVNFYTKDGNRCWIRRVDEVKVLTQGSSLEVHALGEIIGPFFAAITEYLQLKKVPAEKARAATAIIWWEQFAYYRTFPIKPQDIVESTLSSIKGNFGSGALSSLLEDKVDEGDLSELVKTLAKNIGFGKYQMPQESYDPDPLARATKEQTAKYIKGSDYDEKNTRQVPLAGDRVLEFKQEVHRIKSGLLAGEEAVVEGAGQTVIEGKDGKKDVVLSYNKAYAKLSARDKTSIDEQVGLSYVEAANLISEQGVINEIKKLGRAGKLNWDDKLSISLIEQFRKAYNDPKKEWIGTAKPVIPFNKKSIHYRYVIGPFVVNVEARDGRSDPFLSRTVFN